MVKMKPILSKLIAEGVGTFALVFAGCGAVMVAERFPGSLSPVGIAMVFGLVIAVMIYAVGHISGAHFNPAVTLAFAVAGRFPKGQIFGYWVAQCVAGILAIALLKLLLPAGDLYGATIPAIAVWPAVGFEAVLTFFLMFVIIAVATDARAVGTMAGIAIGSTVMLCALFGGAITGASMNPARSLAPALFQGSMNSMWIYLVGPFAGAVVAILLYECIRCENTVDDTESATGKDAKGCC
jgi:MIP family channel proteins